METDVTLEQHAEYDALPETVARLEAIGRMVGTAIAYDAERYVDDSEGMNADLDAVATLLKESGRRAWLVMTETRVVAAGGEGGAFTFSMKSAIVPMLARALMIWFRDIPEAKNYVEIVGELAPEDLLNASIELGLFTITVQSKIGKTPHELRADAYAERDAIAAELVEVKAWKAKEAEALVRVIAERDELRAWQGNQQQALIKMAVDLVDVGYRGDGVVDGVEWLAAKMNAIKGRCEAAAADRDDDQAAHFLADDLLEIIGGKSGPCGA